MLLNTGQHSSSWFFYFFWIIVKQSKANVTAQPELGLSMTSIRNITLNFNITYYFGVQDVCGQNVFSFVFRKNYLLKMFFHTVSTIALGILLSCQLFKVNCVRVFSGTYGTRFSSSIWRFPDREQLSWWYDPCLGLSERYRPKSTHNENIAYRTKPGHVAH